MTDDVQVVSRKQQYLIGKAKKVLPAGIEAVNLSQLKNFLDRAPDIDVVKTIAPRGLLGVFSEEEVHPDAIFVVNMARDRALSLQQAGGDQLLIEPNHYLSYAQIPQQPPTVRIRDAAILVPNRIISATTTITIVVQDDKNQPVAGAQVYLIGNWPTQGITNENGQATLTLFDETIEGLQGLHVEPKADYWSLWIPNPALDPQKNNIVTLRPLSQSFPNFPEQQVLGWGQKAMNLDRLPATYTGKGAKVAIIDSGAATTHQDIAGQIIGGYDLVNNNEQTWDQDQAGHGTHCTGVVAGKSNNNFGIRGFAPEAEVHAFKIFPGGKISDLIEALERCIELQVDVVNLSLGSDQPSTLVEQSLQRAREQGIACIVAAGNSGGAVEYPGASPNVLAVAAIGKQGTFPPDSYQSTEVFVGNGNPFTSQGYFSARFSCFGPQIGVCAPGVAILSSVPPDNFAVWDGTSMAAPHITGLAALILAHHPDFLGQYARHDSQRVERLFTILRQSAQPIELDPNRVGTGLPDALVALNLAPAVAAAGTAPGDAWQHLINDLQQVLTLAGVSAPNTIAQPVGNIAPQAANGVTTPSIRSEDVGMELQKLTSLMQQGGL